MHEAREARSGGVCRECVCAREREAAEREVAVKPCKPNGGEGTSNPETNDAILRIQLLRADLTVGAMLLSILDTDRLAPTHAGVSPRRREAPPLCHPPRFPRKLHALPTRCSRTFLPKQIYASLPRGLATGCPKELEALYRQAPPGPAHNVLREISRACLSLPWIEIQGAQPATRGR